MKMGKKWYVTLIVGVFVYIIYDYVVVPAVNLTQMQVRDPKEALWDELSFIPDDMTLGMIGTVDDVLLTAWDINNQEPKFFSKWAV